MAYLNGIDVSGWQNGIDLAAVPCDFAICKATQGINYVSPDCARQVEQLRSAGKLFGTYHYISGGDANGEAEFYINNIKNWVGEGMLCLDWESNQNSAWGNEEYLKRVAKRVIELTGIPPVIYVQASRYNPVAAVANELNCGLWIAQYATNDTTGYQASPWNEGKYSCAIRQYSSAGRLSGYNGDLDLNKFYGDKDAWLAYVNAKGVTPAPAPSEPAQPAEPAAPSGSTLDLAIGVLQGQYGNGDDRKQALGSRYQEVQDFINHVASASKETLAEEVKAGQYGNGDTRKTILGSRYDEVQAVVNGTSRKSVSEIAREIIAGKWGVGNDRRNRLASAGYDYDQVQAEVNKQLGATDSSSSSSRTYTVRSGDTLSGIGAKLGVDWKTIASMNGIGSPYLIYPGQNLKY